MPGSMTLCLRGPPLPPATSASVLLSWCTSSCLGVICSEHPRVQTCRTWGIPNGGGSPPPGPLLYTTCGGAQGGPRGRTGSRPDLGSPPQGTTLLSMSKERYLMFYGILQRWGWGRVTSQVPLIGTGDGSSETLPPGTHRTQGSRRRYL